MARTISIRIGALGIALALVSLLGSARAATPTDELLRYVPPDVAFCVTLQDLRTHSQRLHQSPFLEQFRKSPLGQALLVSSEWQQLTKLEERLSKQFKLDWTQLRDDIFGDAVVLAYRPGPTGKPEQEQGLILIRARNEKVLTELLDKLNQMMKDAGTLKELQPREHEGVKYWRRVEQAEESFYLTRGPVLVLSGQEQMLQTAIRHDKQLASDKAPPLAVRLKTIQADKAVASLWINPRAFDADLLAQQARAKGDEAVFLKTFHQCWKALDDIGLTLQLNKDLEVNLSLHAQTDKFPVEVRTLLEKASEASELWARFSDTPLFATGLKTDFAALMQILSLLQTKETFQTMQEELNKGLATYLGKTVLEALPDIGPDWGFCMTAPARAEKNWFPAVVFAVRLRPGDASGTVDRGVLDTVHFYAGLLVMSFNKQNKERMSIKTTRFDKLEVRSLSATSTLPPGLQPAYTLHEGYLILASSPETLQRFAATAPRKRVGTDIPLLRISCKEWCRYLKERREPLGAFLAEQQKTSAKEALQALDGILLGLEFVDQLEISHRAAKGQMTLSLRLKLAAPLTKE